MQSTSLYLATILIWGSIWFAIKFQPGVVEAEISLIYRFALAAVILLLFCLLGKRNLRFSTSHHLFMALHGRAIPGDSASPVHPVRRLPVDHRRHFRFWPGLAGELPGIEKTCPRGSRSRRKAGDMIRKRESQEMNLFRQILHPPSNPHGCAGSQEMV